MLYKCIQDRYPFKCDHIYPVKSTWSQIWGKILVVDYCGTEFPVTISATPVNRNYFIPYTRFKKVELVYGAE